MMITGAVQIKVNSAVLNDKAQTVSRQIRNMESCFEQLDTIVNRTSYYWIGEAGDRHRALYREQKPHVEEMMKRLKEHPADLQAIAQNYGMAEFAVQSIAAELPDDVIS